MVLGNLLFWMIFQFIFYVYSVLHSNASVFPPAWNIYNFAATQIFISDGYLHATMDENNSLLM